MNVDEKLALLLAVEQSGFKVTEALKRLDISRTTYYRWRAKVMREGLAGLEDKRPTPKKQWNSLTPKEEATILKLANDYPELSCREISFKITDNESFTVSESTVYRLLKREGLVREQTVQSFPASKEYHTKPCRVNEQWQTDATYLHVEGWGWFYLISVLDDACDKVGLSNDEMPKLVSDRGPALISDDLKVFLTEQNIHHILASPYHPQTNGKIERYHKSLKSKVKLHVYGCPNRLKEEVGKFISYYNKKRYHESLGNVTPDDIFYGRREEITKRRSEKRRLTIMRRKEYNQSSNTVMLC